MTLALMCAASSALAAPQSEPAKLSACPELGPLDADIGDRIPVPAGFDRLAYYDAVSHRAIRDLSKSLQDGTWTVADDDLSFEQIPQEDVTHVQLAWSRRAEGDASPVCLQDFRVKPVSAVISAECFGQRACGLGDQIVIVVEDVEAWLTRAGPSRPGHPGVADLVPFFDEVPIRGVHPENPAAQPTFWATGFHAFTTLRFTLERTPTNSRAWTALLRGFGWEERPMSVSLGFEGGDPMLSWVQRKAPPNDPDAEEYRQFHLLVMRHSSAIGAGLLFVLALLAFIWLARDTDILRDPSAPLRPDNRAPYSLARVQMAVWFFMVMGAWFLLFLVTKDIDTLNGSILVLIGISAGTAIGSAIMDSATTISAAERMRGVPDDPERVSARVQELQGRLARARAFVPTNDSEKEARNLELEQVAGELSLAESQRAFFRRRPWLRATYDLLGDDGHISFHRFQIAVWTLALAFVFVTRVLSNLAMPEFSDTVLGLMGISSGTYLGFKLPAASAAEPKRSS